MVARIIEAILEQIYKILIAIKRANDILNWLDVPIEI
jgi:hypothetical protein